MSETKLLSSTEFAETIGVSVATLKVWDEKGILKPYMKTPTGRRKYSSSQVEEYFSRCRKE